MTFLRAHAAVEYSPILRMDETKAEKSRHHLSTGIRSFAGAFLLDVDAPTEDGCQEYIRLPERGRTSLGCAGQGQLDPHQECCHLTDAQKSHSPRGISGRTA